MDSSHLDVEPVRDARDQLLNDLEQLTVHAQDLVQATRSLSEDVVSQARERLEQRLVLARQQLAELKQQARQRSLSAVADLEAQVKSQPREAVATVALTSLALAWLSRSSGIVGDLARLASIGVAGAAGAILWRHHAAATQPAEAQPKREALAKTRARSRPASASG